MQNIRIYTLCLFGFTLISCDNEKDELKLNENTTNLHIESPLQNEQGHSADTVLSYRVEKDNTYNLCKEWIEPKATEILPILYQMTEISGNNWNDCYGNWECGIEGKLIYNSLEYNYHLDACGWIILTNNSQNIQRYFGCRSVNCWESFPADSDCDENGNALY